MLLETFNPNKSTSVIHVIISHSITSACFLLSYSYMLPFLCFIFHRYPRHHSTECCGKLAFNQSDTTKLCCNNTLHSDTIGKACCGNQLIDPTNTTCKTFKDMAFSLEKPLAQIIFCSEGSYNDSRYTCCEGILHQALGKCCGYNLITDNSQETCCGGKVQKYDPTSICCDGVSYSKSYYVCCGGKALNVFHQSQACCNNSIYNKYEQVCDDNGSLSFKETPGPSTYRPVSRSVAALRHPAFVIPRCGNKTYDNRTSSCCSGQVYSIFSERCENGSVVRTSKLTV